MNLPKCFVTGSSFPGAAAGALSIRHENSASGAGGGNPQPSERFFTPKKTTPLLSHTVQRQHVTDRWSAVKGRRRIVYCVVVVVSARLRRPASASAMRSVLLFSGAV